MALAEVLKKYPVVSVIINTHNSPKSPTLLKRALKSVQAQVFDQTFEVLMVCDGQPSEDIVNAVKEIADSEGSEAGDLLRLNNGDAVPFAFFGAGDEASGYQCYPKNQAIYVAKGEYICFLDQDNEFSTNHLQVLWNAMYEDKIWPDFTYGRRKYVIDEGCETTVKLPGGQEITLNEKESPFIQFTAETAQMLGTPSTNFIDTSDFMIAKGALWRTYMATGMMWNEGKRRFGDWELIARMVFFAGIRGKGVDEVVQTYHWTGDNMQLTRSPNEEPKKERV